MVAADPKPTESKNLSTASLGFDLCSLSLFSFNFFQFSTQPFSMKRKQPLAGTEEVLLKNLPQKREREKERIISQEK